MNQLSHELLDRTTEAHKCACDLVSDISKLIIHSSRYDVRAVDSKLLIEVCEVAIQRIKVINERLKKTLSAYETTNSVQ